MSSLRIKGSIWIENNKGNVFGPGKKELLEAIRDTGSIKAAAKAMKMSYRHAWEMANSANKISVRPLIKKSTGGASGGGTRLTREGERLILMYEELFAEFVKFKQQQNKNI
jgi:molybdate transport system regulatory protein